MLYFLTVFNIYDHHSYSCVSRNPEPVKRNFRCSVPKCQNVRGANEEISFHALPQKKSTALQWIKNLKLNSPATPNTFVCSEHFNKKDFYHDGIQLRNVLFLYDLKLIYYLLYRFSKI